MIIYDKFYDIRLFNEYIIESREKYYQDQLNNIGFNIDSILI